METESVKTIKAAARACAEIEKQWDYPMASCALSTAINGILGAYLWCEDSEEADKGIVRISSVYKSGFGSGFAEKDDDAATIIDLSKLIQERAKWQKVYIDCRPINNFMDESPDLYQIVTIDGWC